MLPRAVSPIGNTTWVTINAPSTLPSGSTAGNNWTVLFTQDDIGHTWQENDAFILDGVRFEAHVVPTKPTHFVCEATGTLGMEASMRGLVKAINNHYRFSGRYYASTDQVVATSAWTLQVIALRPGGVFDLDYSLERTVAGVVGANDIFTSPNNELPGQGPTQGEDLDGYGTFVKVWAHKSWVYGDGNTAFTPGVDATPLVKLRQNYQPGGAYEFDLTGVTASQLPDWLPELGFVPAAYPDGGGTSLGRAGALAAYFIEAGQFKRDAGQFRDEDVEYTSGPLFAWRGAIKALNPTEQEYRRVTGVGLPAARRQQVLTSLASSVGRDPLLGEQPSVIVIPRSQEVQYLSFLHTRVEMLSDIPQFRWVRLEANYTFLNPDGSTLRVPAVGIYDSEEAILSLNEVSPADVYYARIDWSKILYSAETVLHEYFDSTTTEEDYPLIKAEFYFMARENSTADQVLTEPVTVYYPQDSCQDDYQPTIVFRNHWGAYEGVQMRAGFSSDTNRTALEWERLTGRETTFKDLVQFSLVQDSQTSFVLTSKPLTALESAVMRELVATDRVFLYHYGPDFTINNQAPTSPAAEMLIPLIVTDAKLKYDTEQAGNVLQLTVRLSNTAKSWSSPNTDALRIKLARALGDGGGTTPSGGGTGGLELGDEEPID